MFRKIFIILAAVVVLVVIFVATRPAEFEIEREVRIAAPAERIFAEVSDLHRWQAWSPWANLDPDARNSFSGPTAGEGAIFSWSGNREVGEGTMTIVDSHPPEFIRIRLDFTKPFEGTNFSEFALEPASTGTLVSWRMTGKNNFIAKAASLFIDMDTVLGGQFERGLASLKATTEAAHP